MQILTIEVKSMCWFWHW